MKKTKQTNNVARQPLLKKDGTPRISRQQLAETILANQSERDFLKVETKPPAMVNNTYTMAEFNFYRSKLKDAANETRPGMAFIIPKVLWGMTNKYLKEDFPDDKFIKNDIIDNPHQIRVYKKKIVK